jgi:hypothetical protein
MQESVVIFTPNALEAKQQGIINMTELLCFGRIYALTNKGTKACYCRDKTLASAIGYSLETADKIIGKAVSHLKQLGVIETQTIVNSSTKRRERHASIIADFQLKDIPPSQGGMVDTIPPRQGGIYTPSAGGNAYPLGKGEFNKTYNRHKTEREAEHKKSDFLTSINKVKSQHEELNEFDSDKLADFIVSHLANKPRKIVDLDAFMYEVMTSWTGARRAALVKPTRAVKNKKQSMSANTLLAYRNKKNGTYDR